MGKHALPYYDMSSEDDFIYPSGILAKTAAKFRWRIKNAILSGFWKIVRITPNRNSTSLGQVVIFNQLVTGIISVGSIPNPEIYAKLVSSNFLISFIRTGATVRRLHAVATRRPCRR